MTEEEPRPPIEEYADIINEVLEKALPQDRRREAVEREYASALEDIRELLETERELSYANTRRRRR